MIKTEHAEAPRTDPNPMDPRSSERLSRAEPSSRSPARSGAIRSESSLVDEEPARLARMGGDRDD